MGIFKKILYPSLFLLITFSSRANTQTITLAVASNFSVVLENLLNDFESLNPDVKTVLVSGSSGKIYAQIRHGAPFDIFMSADQDKPLKLIEEGIAIPDTRFTYAIGSLILWSANPDLINNTNQALMALAFNKLALANSRLAPYGFAAEEVLGKLGLLSSSRSKWVQGENIAQAYQFVKTRNADLGFVAQSQVWKHNRLISGSAWKIPTELYSPIKQDTVILKNAKNIELAKKVMLFLQTAEVRHKIESFGYQSISVKPDRIQSVSR